MMGVRKRALSIVGQEHIGQGREVQRLWGSSLHGTWLEPSEWREKR